MFYSISEVIIALGSLSFKRMKVLSRSISVYATSDFKYPDVAKTLSTMHDKYVVVHADKAKINSVIVCKTHYVEYKAHR